MRSTRSLRSNSQVGKVCRGSRCVFSNTGKHEFTFLGLRHGMKRYRCIYCCCNKYRRTQKNDMGGVRW